jgi:hypothetical protein
MGANCGAEIFGVETLGSTGDVARFLEIAGMVGLEGGGWILGTLRLSDSAILEVSFVFGGTEIGSGFLKGVTSLRDGRAGAGFTDGWMVGGGGGEEGRGFAFTGSWLVGGIFV